MTTENALNLLATMPGKPDWNPDIASLYSLHLADWHPETRHKAILEATSICHYRPTTAELREIALRFAQPLPSAASSLAEIRRIVTFYPPRERALQASSLVRDLVDELGGWAEIGMLPTEELERRFPGACDRTRKEYLTRNAQKLLSQEPSKLLEGMGSPKPKELGI